MFLVDEIEPKSIKDVVFHRDIYNVLKKMSEDDAIPHIIFHGPPGSGKKVMTKLFLNMLYGDNVKNIYTIKHEIVGSGNKIKVELIEKSDHHIIINPTGTNYDRYLVHEIIRNYTKINTIRMNDPTYKFRSIQINELDKLSTQGQTALRRMMEKYSNKCRFVMWSNNISNIIKPLQSRCICIRVPRPTDSELFAHLVMTSIKKNIMPDYNEINNIIMQSEGDIKKSFWLLQLNILGYDNKTTYDIALNNLIDLLILNDLKKIDEIRNILFNIMITNIDGITILKDIINLIVESKKISEYHKYRLLIKYAEIEYNMIRGRREIIHFDAIITNTLYILNDCDLKNELLN